MCASRHGLVTCSVALFVCALALSPDVSAGKLRLPNPWKELVRPNCAGDDCLAADYGEHKELLKEQEEERRRQEKEAAKQRKRAEKQAAKERQRESCKKLKGSGTAHTTRQC